jgi:hypothetical protein
VIGADGSEGYQAEEFWHHKNPHRTDEYQCRSVRIFGWPPREERKSWRKILRPNEMSLQRDQQLRAAAQDTRGWRPGPAGLSYACALRRPSVEPHLRQSNVIAHELRAQFDKALFFGG